MVGGIVQLVHPSSLGKCPWMLLKGLECPHLLPGLSVDKRIKNKFLLFIKKKQKNNLSVASPKTVVRVTDHQYVLI